MDTHLFVLDDELDEEGGKMGRKWARNLRKREKNLGKRVRNRGNLGEFWEAIGGRKGSGLDR